MSFEAAKISNYVGQTTPEQVRDHFVAVDRDLQNLFKVASMFYQFGTGTSYSILTYTSTNYKWFPTVGAWNITSTLLYGGSGANYIGFKPGTGIWMGDETFANAEFSVDQTGSMKAHSGRIGGWYIGSTTLSSTNIVLDSDNELIRTTDFVSGALGDGWQIDANTAEFNNIRARGKIVCATFEKDTISSVGGNFLVCDSDILNADMTAADNSTLTILGDTTFAVNDILRIKDGVDDEWLQVTNIAAAPTYTVTRDKASAYAANTNPIWKKGTAVVNYGASGEGMVFLTASDTNAPHIDVITHAGAPWTTTTTRMRMGNLNGFLGYSSDLYGIAIGEATKYLKYDPTDGLQIKGTVVMSSVSSVSSLPVGTITGWAASGDTTKIDGGKIYTSSIVSDSISSTAITSDKLSVAQLDAITISTGSLVVDEYIQSANYVAGTTGFKLDSSSGLEINTGIIKGKTIIDGVWLSGFQNYGGDSSDGSVTISANTNISKSCKQYTNLTIDAGKTLTALNTVIGVTGTLTVSGVISASAGGGANGLGGHENENGTSGASVEGRFAGGGGGSGGAGSGGTSGSGGDAGGLGGLGVAASHVGNSGSATASTTEKILTKIFNSAVLSSGGGGGGGASGGNTSSAGGRGGSGGGFVFIECTTLDFNTGAKIIANGQDGADGSASSAGGGGGGGGGVVLIRYKNIIDNNGTVEVNGGIGGLGATGDYDGGDGGSGTSVMVQIT